MKKLKFKTKINSDVSENEQLEAIQAINDISDVILTAEGLHDGDEPTDDQIDFVLQTVSDLVVSPENSDELEFEDVQEDYQEEFGEETDETEETEDVDSAVKAKLVCYKSGKKNDKIISSYDNSDEGGILLITEPSIVEAVEEVFEKVADGATECEDCEELVVTDSDELQDSDEVVYGLTLSSVKKAISKIKKGYYKLASKMIPNGNLLSKLVCSSILQHNLKDSISKARIISDADTTQEFYDNLKYLLDDSEPKPEGVVGGAEVKPHEESMDTNTTDSSNEPVEVNSVEPDGDIPTIDEAANDDVPKTYDFEDTENIEVVEIPINGLDDTNVMALQVVNSRVSIIKQAYINPGVGKRSGYYTGDAARKILSNKALIPCKTPYLDGQVINIKSLGTGCIFSNSSVLGLVAVKAPIIKGIKNTKYSIFSRSNGKLRDKFGNTINSSVNLVIASSASNRSSKKDEPCDYVGVIESAYINNLKEKSNKQRKLILSMKGSMISERKQRDKLITILSRTILNMKAEHNKVIQSSISDLEHIRSKAYKAEQDRLFKSNVEFVNQQHKNSIESHKRNIDLLTKLM